MQHFRFSSRRLPRLVCGATLLAACSAAEEPSPPIDGARLESVDGVPAEGLVARIVGATNSGELCPKMPWDKDHDGFPDNVLVAATEDFVSFSFGPVLYECGTEEAESYSRDLSANPSCTVTLDVEVPAGVRMAVPVAVWRGYASDPEGQVTAKRSYAFEGGESVSTPVAGLPTDFMLWDRAQAAYSPTCAETKRVRLTATFQAALAGPSSVLQLDGLDFVTSWRGGADFKEGCASDEFVKATPAAAGEWCGGHHGRACASGLQCDFYERDFVTGNAAGAEGTCVDVSRPGGTAELGKSCGGLTKIQCPAGAVCWHEPAAPPNWRGKCTREAAVKGDPCGIGQPALECASPFTCIEATETCAEARGETGDPCGQVNLPDCVHPRYCSQESFQCVMPRGAGGDPCGSPELPACVSPAYCENQRCVDPRGNLDAACGEGTPGCLPHLACINSVCSRKAAATCVTPKN